MAEEKIISRQDAEKVARLAQLHFDGPELDDCLDKLGAILEYMQELRGIDTAGVAPTTHVLDLENVLRDDRPGPTLPREQALANAPSSQDGQFFRVPRII